MREEQESVLADHRTIETQIYYLFSRVFHRERSTIVQRIGENLSWDTVPVSGCSRSSNVNSKKIV